MSNLLAQTTKEALEALPASAGSCREAFYVPILGMSMDPEIQKASIVFDDK